MNTPKERLDAFLAAGIGYMSRDRLDALRRDFDALLAEHRAEVEALRDELKRTNLSWASARDAALEEGATEMKRIGEERAAIRLRALKSTPASVLPVDKVREVLRGLTPSDDLLAAGYRYALGVRDALSQAADILGVDLDAKAEPVLAPPRKESVRECTCTGSCRGADGLGPGWRCALQR